MRDVVEVQHGGGAEHVHFRLLLLLPTRLAPAFLLPFSWLSKTSIYTGQKLVLITLKICSNMLNIFSTFPTELKGKKVPKGEKKTVTTAKPFV